MSETCSLFCLLLMAGLQRNRCQLVYPRIQPDGTSHICVGFRIEPTAVDLLRLKLPSH